MSSMQKIILIIIVLIVVGCLYYVTWFQGSQLQFIIKSQLADNDPSRNYKNYSDTKCGIWFESNNKAGSHNAKVEECLTQAFQVCNEAATLLIKEQGGQTTYSMIRMLGRNQDHACIVQNTFHMKKNDNTVQDWTNSCSELDQDKPYKSCEPGLNIQL